MNTTKVDNSIKVVLRLRKRIQTHLGEGENSDSSGTAPWKKGPLR